MHGHLNVKFVNNEYSYTSMSLKALTPYARTTYFYCIILPASMK